MLTAGNTDSVNLRRHCSAPWPDGHGQPADAVEAGPDELLAQWHEHEHTPRLGYPTLTGHAHDEFTARREGVPHARR